MSKNRTGKSLTYEEIGEKLNLSPQQVHKIEKEAFNKIIKRMTATSKTNVFDVILSLSEFLGIDPDQCYKKLDKFNNEKLCLHVRDHYGKNVAGFVPSQIGFEDLFE